MAFTSDILRWKEFAILDELATECDCVKKLISLVLSIATLILLVGCHETPPKNQEASSNFTSKSMNVLKAWSGDFSEEKLKSAINEYQSNYTNIVLEKDNTSSVSFETDFEVSSCSMGRLSRTDDTDIEVELNSYIDLFLETNYDGRTVTIPLDWWYTGEDSWVNDYLVWSYLVHVKDANGSNHYYYFRVDYSAYAQ